MAGVFASLRCFFGHQWRYVRAANNALDTCVRCGAARVHVPGTKAL